ncbi:group III truncated hemoglobin [Dyella choica]|uniref:Group III truncated hemoglobin n=1 Tax=Dyella choica TaxID=1927959 RepID=A0A432M4T3_9GAMM|nr:group III truncated hemoglobin [Dyella choica]RUL74498.1 group III truncated hemoglobin [Dyella choica]
MQDAKLDAAQIARLVDRFYEKVRADSLLGPVFNAAVHDWVEHKLTLTSFWCSVALGANSYRGNPMAVHRMLHGIRTEHFERWLSLWQNTTREELDEAGARLMLGHADRIGRSLRLGMGLQERIGVRPFSIPVIGRG